ncbi:MAG: sulfate reduction electron transfer complex DsrMKJOP subunit DsrM [Deltaproteobacteria bacterium]|nr:sulfate reduction electron transfer complex DsrMKJOP subunit DsrM [Deltaproteobacteria bacterium]MBW2067338.1 sulfate reduction electron transfer complex DsrMKJOP subunit DsrM [Deltaproteobacteria bacterium]
MGMKFALNVVLGLALFAIVGVKLLGLNYLFGVVIPYLAVTLFFLGFIHRIFMWARSAVPFRIPTTGGQQYSSLPWVKSSKFDNPHTKWGVVVRMALEVLVFRSLFRNTKMLKREGKITYHWEKWLWIAALAFHYSFLVIFLRHLRFFTDPVPGFVQFLEKADSFFEMALPGLLMSDIVLVAAVTYLLIRRIIIPQVKYVSLPADYFVLFLILGLGLTGILMRYFWRVDIIKIKELTMGLATFHPVVPDGLSVIFYMHLFFVSTLFAYFPFSKLMHMPGVFLSPTRNLPNDTRMRRHVNPWDYPVKVHTYEAYEEEFREKMVEAGIPVEKPLEKPVEQQEE